MTLKPSFRKKSITKKDPVCHVTTYCVVKGCNKRVHCIWKSGHGGGHRYGSHASQH